MFVEVLHLVHSLVCKFTVKFTWWVLRVLDVVLRSFHFAQLSADTL